jgi:molybdenum cofactor cytidylyltransferase
MSPHVIILAGGASTRLGQPKQLVKLGGRPALHIVISNAVAVAGSDVTVVLGAHAREWEEGMASSIRAGLAALPPACEAVMIILGDQVGITADDLKRLIDAWNGNEGVIAAAVYDQHVGVPAIFPAFCFTELAQLRGDRGARVVLERNRDRVVHVQMPRAAIDLDT